MPANRSALYDNVKLFLICCVVIGHLGNVYSGHSHAVASVQFWVYLFHMPAFILIAGMFSKRTVKDKKWKKVVPYIFLYLTMELLNYIVYIIVYGYEKVSLDLLHENGIPWYALAMFWWLALTILIQKVNPVYVMITSVCLSLLSGYSSDINSFLVIQRTIIFYPFFYLGYILDPEKLQAFLKKKICIVSAFILLIASFIVSYFCYEGIYFWRTLFRGLAAYADIHDGLSSEFGFLWRLAAYAISLLLTFSVIAVIPSVRSFLSVLGQRTLPVFVFHGPILTLVLVKILPVYNFILNGPVLLLCLVFMIILVMVLSLKPFNWIVRKIMLY